MTIDLTTLPTTMLPMVAFCIGIYFIVLIVRLLIEAAWPKVCEFKGWGKILRLLPPLVGGVLAVIMSQYPYLCTLPTWGTRFVYGCFGGGIASFAYLCFKAAVQRYFGVKVDGEDGDKEEKSSSEEKS